MSQQLPIVKIEGKHYVKDDRLQEYREVANPQRKIAYEDIGERMVEAVAQNKNQRNVKRRLQ